MKKTLIFKTLYLFLVLIVVAGASVFATNTYLSARDVSYGNSNVENALNGLFTLKGNDENYSIDAKVVGKWIDGKPIYRKCIDLGSYKGNTTIDLTSYNLNIDYLISCKSTGNNGGNWYDFSMTNNHDTALYFKGNFNTLAIAGTTTIRYIILEYTKTSDVPANN